MRRQEAAVIKLKTNVNNGDGGLETPASGQEQVKAQKTTATVGRKERHTALSRGKPPEMQWRGGDGDAHTWRPQGCRHSGRVPAGEPGGDTGWGGGHSGEFVSLPAKCKVPVGCTVENAQQGIRDVGARSKEAVKTARARKLTWDTQQLQRFAKVSEAYELSILSSLWCPEL